MSDTTYKIGDTVFVTDDSLPAGYVGTHGVIDQIDTSDPDGQPIFVRFEATDTRNARHYWVKLGQFSVTLPDAATPVEPAIITDLQAQIDTLTNERDRQVTLRSLSDDRLREQQDRYRHDMNVIDRIMLRVKDEQSWCDDGYSEIAKEINEEMQGGFEFTVPRKLVKKRARLRGEVYVNKEVWVYEDEDEDDPDNWYDEEGDSLNIDIDEELTEEASNNGWDTSEVEDVSSSRY